MLPIREYLPGEEIKVRDPLNEREERKKVEWIRVTVIKQYPHWVLVRKKSGMRFGVTNAELFCAQWTGKTYTKDGTTKEISESKRKFPKLNFGNW